MAADGSGEWRRRSELTGLLRACRSRLIRADGDGRGGGLRQEDVADLAGLSVRGYAAFERGESARPEPQTVEAVAAALRMTDAERDCLHVLATGRERPPPGDAARLGVSAVLADLLAAQDPNPAFIADETWALIAWNQPAGAWGGTWLASAADGHPNLALYLFGDRCEEVLADVRAARRAMLAGLRYQYARDIASDRLAGLIAALLGTGPEARELWDRHEVAIPPREYRLRLRHPGRGVIEAPGVAMPVSARLSMHVIVLPAGVTPPGPLPRPGGTGT